MTVPTVADFTSATVTDQFDDMFSPPGLTNHWATVQVDHDVLAVRSLNVPPISQGDTVTGRLYLQGRLAESYGQPVEVTWRPDRVDRRTRIEDWQVDTVTVTPPGEPGVLVRLSVTNTAVEARTLRLGLWVQSTVTRPDHPWLAAEPPQADNSLWRDPVRPDGSRASVRWAAPGPAPAGTESATTLRGGVPGSQELSLPAGAGAISLQALVAADGSELEDRSATPRIIETSIELAPGQTWQGGYIHVIAGDADLATAAYRRIADDLEGQLTASTRAWDEELAALFTPGNDLYSGHLPMLETSNDALRQLYWWGALGVAWFRRDNPASVLGRVYDTLMPRYWQTTTFIWDYSLSSMVHAQLDPKVMRRQILHWTGLDINQHFSTEWLTGGPVGYWYSVNQYALVRLVADYVRFTGDVSILDEVVGEDQSQLGDHVRAWALAWQDKRSDSGLADYGGIDNLLECVSTYVHEVASLQAANVWAMRTAAELSELQGRVEDAEHLRAEADALLPKVLELYREGDGFFHARQPDGSLLETRHCYDFATVGTTIAEDLPQAMRAEMVAFFDAELRTENWMRALSPLDPDAGFSVRPDHQWNGAYPAWPPDSARSAIELGAAELVADWMVGLARSTRQGPPGQAHFVDEAAPPVEGGARKAPGQWPYLIDWSCSSAGAWCELVLAGVFGVEVPVGGEPTVTSRLSAFDPDARLTGLAVGDRLWTVDKDGTHPA
ncbi:glucosidase family protein [Parenemella sanctibonifatiensis]|uniref:Alpha-L-rhamnosidase six-hairpin glycosidase domain-containing protein n=1 Tax=Parenemella sanctibonifatiensis TaxID=2016505 RepID=A0A255EFL3_9ACTN|nr:hypothetical protein [Parenemella sanctibonifatiensis]OYN90319.1 hypothetical protein CGZ91_09175 [Parenemella sanctibonifatiensis]